MAKPIIPAPKSKTTDKYKSLKNIAIWGGGPLFLACALTFGPQFLYIFPVIVLGGAYILYPDEIANYFESQQHLLIGGIFGTIMTISIGLGPLGFFVGAWAAYFINEKVVQMTSLAEPVLHPVNFTTKKISQVTEGMKTGLNAVAAAISDIIPEKISDNPAPAITQQKQQAEKPSRLNKTLEYLGLPHTAPLTPAKEQPITVKPKTIPVKKKPDGDTNSAQFKKTLKYLGFPVQPLESVRREAVTPKAPPVIQQAVRPKLPSPLIIDDNPRTPVESTPTPPAMTALPEAPKEIGKPHATL